MATSGRDTARTPRARPRRRRRGCASRCWPLVVAVAALPLVVTDRFTLKVLTLIGHQRDRRRRPRAALRLRGPDLARARGLLRDRARTRPRTSSRRSACPWFVGPLARGRRRARALGLLLALPTMRLKGHYLAMATLGFGEIMAVAFVELKWITGGPDGLSGIPFPTLGSLHDARARRELLAGLGGRWGSCVLLAYNLVRLAPRPGAARAARVRGRRLGVRGGREPGQDRGVRAVGRRWPGWRARSTPTSSASSRRRRSGS